MSMDTPLSELPPEERKKKYLEGAERSDAAAAQAYEKYARGEEYPRNLHRQGPKTWKEAGDAAAKAAAAKAAAAARRAAKDIDGQ